MPSPHRGVVRAGLVRGRDLPEGDYPPPQEVGLLELTGASRRGSACQLGSVHRLRVAAAVSALTVAAGVVFSAAQATGSSLHPINLRCIEACAGKQTAAAHSLVRIMGSGLSHVSEVSFRSGGPGVAAEPKSAGNHRVLVRVASGATTGPLRVL